MAGPTNETFLDLERESARLRREEDAADLRWFEERQAEESIDFEDFIATLS
jgi:hypothetical protein